MVANNSTPIISCNISMITSNTIISNNITGVNNITNSINIIRVNNTTNYIIITGDYCTIFVGDRGPHAFL